MFKPSVQKDPRFYRAYFACELLLLMTALIVWGSTLFAADGRAITNYWQCSSMDANSRIWTQQSQYELTASSRAYESCKKESALPKTCKITKNDCEQFIDGITTRPMWRCVALDQRAKRWPSQYYINADEAAVAAKNACQQQSKAPSTCYVNLITCRNVNPVSR